MEAAAYEFACHLLIPESELRKAFDGRSAVRLLQAKEKFGISMAAMIYRDSHENHQREDREVALDSICESADGEQMSQE